ncbi:DEAD-domain-containing protein [Fragilariopsis cylindrus CCMP1102]|uniref:DEAD-domain-containing protein n=1 Tax=Fragilariopsis cylindrus CCMP1102 TaxID=635003 RepID=A0A1E7FX21_9STRA|nr:DEAD-domain-containing protein [Fragilariopsis cylindrus CCMP1102]|eukprot:OEU22353.1 DEAD-domain-containing protein [Fragilariopsis cylindrus CCMP1102]
MVKPSNNSSLNKKKKLKKQRKKKEEMTEIENNGDQHREEVGIKTTTSSSTSNEAQATTDTSAVAVADDDEPDIVTKTSFKSLGVCDALVEACDNLGWSSATRIQEKVLPDALKGRDIIGLAETGSGKTGAFCIPMLQALLENPIRGAVFGVVLAPTRELAFQIHTVVEGLGTTMGATSLCIVGGVPVTQQSIALGRNPHILVATPGRLIDHLTNTKGFNLSNLQYLVLDEADRMLSLDFEAELNELLQVIPEKRKTLLFSATMTSKVQKLQRACLKDPVKVEVSTKFQTPKKLLQSYLFVPAKYKDCYLTYLINAYAGQSILVFGATCNNVQRLALMLRNLGFPAICLHGQMSQPKRLGALHKFTSGSRSVLICTDIAARGLDIPSVDVVINFDLPGHGKDYIHRVGRTARAGRSGKAIAMVTQYDVEIYQRLEGLLGKKLPECKLDEETVLILLERVNEAQRLATRELKEQLAGCKGSGGIRKRRGTGDMRKEIKKGYYAGGSGGRGGALPNQRGSGSQKKRKY